jgi:hypothetical protein
MVAEKKPARGKRGAKPKDEDIFISPEEGWQILEELAQRYMHMSAKEFIRAWNAGEIENPDRPEVIHVLMMLPLAR